MFLPLISAFAWKCRTTVRLRLWLWFFPEKTVCNFVCIINSYSKPIRPTRLDSGREGGGGGKSVMIAKKLLTLRSVAVTLTRLAFRPLRSSSLNRGSLMTQLFTSARVSHRRIRSYHENVRHLLKTEDLTSVRNPTVDVC